MANNRIKLSVSGIPLAISTQEDESYVLKLGETMDRDMSLIMAEGTNVSVTNASILCAIDYLDKYQKANRSVANMRSQIKEYLAEAANSKLLFDEEKKKNIELAAEVNTLKAQLNKLAGSGVNYESAASDIEQLRRSNGEAVEQVKTLSERVAALNDYISSQDVEIASLKKQTNEAVDRTGAQSKNIAELEHLNDARQKEIERLENQLLTYERLLSDKAADSLEPPPAPNLDATQEFPPIGLGQIDPAPFDAPAPQPLGQPGDASATFTDLFTGLDNAGNIPASDGFDFSNLNTDGLDLEGLYSDAQAELPPADFTTTTQDFGAPLPFGQMPGDPEPAPAEPVAPQQQEKESGDEDALPNLSWTEEI